MFFNAYFLNNIQSPFISSSYPFSPRHLTPLLSTNHSPTRVGISLQRIDRIRRVRWQEVDRPTPPREHGPERRTERHRGGRGGRGEGRGDSRLVHPSEDSATVGCRSHHQGHTQLHGWVQALAQADTSGHRRTQSDTDTGGHRRA